MVVTAVTVVIVLDAVDTVVVVDVSVLECIAFVVVVAVMSVEGESVGATPSLKCRRGRALSHHAQAWFDRAACCVSAHPGDYRLSGAAIAAQVSKGSPKSSTLLCVAAPTGSYGAAPKSRVGRGLPQTAVCVDKAVNESVI